MKKNKKIILFSFLLSIIIILLLQVCVFAEYTPPESIVDTSISGAITIHVVESQHGAINPSPSPGTGALGQTLPPNTNPLKEGGNQGVKFNLYKVSDSYSDPTVTPTGVTPTQLKTGENGIVKFNNLTQGRYLISVAEYPVNASSVINNFLVDVPTQNVNNRSWIYDVHVYPKMQTIYGNVTFTKKDEAGNGLNGAKFKLFKKQLNAHNEEEYVQYTNTEFITKTSYDTITKTSSNTANVGEIIIKNLPSGEYQLIETEAPSKFGLNTTPVEFSITATTIANITKQMTNYNTPKKDGFVFNKKINGVSSGGSMIDANQNWKITLGIPKDISNYTRYLVTDEINPKLILDESSIKIKVDSIDLDLNTDYEVLYTGPDNNKVLKILFTDKTKLNANSSKNIVITYTTKFKRDTGGIQMGEDITNTAKLYWDTIYDDDGDDSGSETPMNPQGDDESEKNITIKDPAHVHTGGYKAIVVNDKSGSNRKTLEGAIFRIAKTEADAKAGKFIEIDDNVLEAVSGSNGIIEFNGLAYGTDGDENSSTYYLVEIQAPNGNYKLFKEPRRVTITSTSHNSPEELIHKEEIVLPGTGGIGKVIFIVIGLSLMAIAIVIYVKKDKDEIEV